jgi:SAM-dependent methyltransferase
MSSTRQNPAEQAKALASQLKCPMGDTGQELAHSLNLWNLPMIVSALNALGIEEDDRILEAGPGNGGLLNYILSLAENLHYDGVEISPLMYEQARAANNVFIAEGLAEYALYDGVNLPYEDGIFTKVLSVNTVYFWEEPAWLLAEMCRVLTAGGRVCLSFCEKIL